MDVHSATEALTVPAAGEPTRRALLACLAALLWLPAACQSDSSKSEDPTDELVGSPVRPSADDQPADPDPQSIRRGALWYRMVVERQSVSITLRLLHPADQTSFFLPSSMASDTGARRAFTMSGARGPGGTLPVEQDPDEGRIDIATGELEWVELSYQIDLTAFPERRDRPTPEFSDGTALVYAPDVLVVPSKRIVDQIRNIPVEVHTPRDWRLLATWSPRENKPSKTDDVRRVAGFVAPDVRSLRDAFLVTGPDIRVVERPDGEERLTAAFEAGFDRDPDRYAALVDRTVRHYRNQYGSVGPVLAYFRTGDGDHTDGIRGTAKRGGFVVRTPPDAENDPDPALLIAHEAFHLWNGHELIPDPDHQEQTRWFKEGATHYVAIKALYQTGLFDLEDVRREIGRSAFFYRRNPAARGRRASALDLHRLPYDRGLLLALAFDAALLKCSSGRVSIDDWLRALLDEGGRYYDQETLRTAFQRATDGGCPSGGRIWQRHVESDGTLEPADILGSVGLHLLEARTLEETKVLPVEGHDQLFRRLFSRPDASTPPTADETATSTHSTSPDTDDGGHE